MIDWTKSMKQTFEFYKVDPKTWKDAELVDTIESCTIDRDSSASTLGSTTINTSSDMDECYIRAYLKVNQNGEEERVALGTCLVQTPSNDFDGKRLDMSIDAYTPLLELKDSYPPLGYSVLKGTNIMDIATTLCRENMQAPVVPAKSDHTLNYDFVANLDDTWLVFIADFISNAKFTFDIDPMGRILFAPKQDTASLQPVWIYDDSNCSILYPEITNKRDLYGIPNVVEVIYSTDSGFLYSKVVNDDPNSPVSTVTRGREVMYRVSNPNFSGHPTQADIDEYARQVLRDLSSLEHTVKYKHGYCPVRVGDAVTLDIKSMGLRNIKAKVIAQSIKCSTGCPVTETAVYTTNLWR